jgi:hypothetical protein
MQGVADEDVAAGVWQPLNIMARPVAENMAVKEGSFAFMVLKKVALLWI